MDSKKNDLHPLILYLKYLCNWFGHTFKDINWICTGLPGGYITLPGKSLPAYTNMLTVHNRCNQ